MLSPQGHGSIGERTDLLVEIVGASFVLACAQDPGTMLTEQTRHVLNTLEVRVLHLVPTDSGDASDPRTTNGSHTPTTSQQAVDVDETYLAQMAATGHIAMLIRPDNYVFGTATGSDDLNALIDNLGTALIDNLGT